MLPPMFAESVRQFRWDMGLTQSEVEVAADLRFGYMSYLETGRMKRLPNAPELKRMCRALGITLLDALDEADYLVFEMADIDRLDAALASLTLRAA